MATLYTVKPATLLADAARIEAHARESLESWILLGLSAKYHAAMHEARVLRAAAESPSPAYRREVLRNAGFIVKTPRDASAARQA